MRNDFSGIRTGLTEFDRMTSGFQPGALIVCAARPAMGKTALGINNIVRQAVLSSRPVAVFSLEMSGEQIFKRLSAADAYLDTMFRSDERSANDVVRIVPDNRMVYENDLFLNDSPDLSTGEIRRFAKKIKAERGLDLILVDYLQLVADDGTGYAGITGAFKKLARELDVPVVILSQLKRTVEEREDKRPRLSDLLEFGAIEEHADIVFFLHRPNVYDGDLDPEVAELIIAKNRNGLAGSIRLRFAPEVMMFFDGG